MQKDSEKGVATKFFDFNTAAEVLFSPPMQDFTKQDNLLVRRPPKLCAG